MSYKDLEWEDRPRDFYETTPSLHNCQRFLSLRKKWLEDGRNLFIKHGFLDEAYENSRRLDLLIEKEAIVNRRLTERSDEEAVIPPC